MSDLAATNCGCGCDCDDRGGFECGNIIWILLILSCCGGGCFGGRGRDGCDGGFNCIWIILLLCCCGGFGGRGGFC